MPSSAVPPSHSERNILNKKEVNSLQSDALLIASFDRLLTGQRHWSGDGRKTTPFLAGLKDAALQCIDPMPLRQAQDENSL